MSQENVEIVKEIMQLMSVAAAGGGPTPGLIERFAPDVVVDMSRRVFNPDVYEGHEGLRRLGREVNEVWASFRIEPERFIESGDRVIVIERRRGRGRESQVEVEARSGVIWTLRDGKVVRMETDLAPADALQAAGLSE
jgi:ketosteroid isomerase-like protein